MRESILIIEDEIGLIKMLKRLLEKEGFPNIYQAESGLETLKIVKQNRIDLILLDVMLPDTDGFTLCQQIRKISDVPIIFLTARTTDVRYMSSKLSHFILINFALTKRFAIDMGPLPIYFFNLGAMA